MGDEELEPARCSVDYESHAWRWTQALTRQCERCHLVDLDGERLIGRIADTLPADAYPALAALLRKRTAAARPGRRGPS